MSAISQKSVLSQQNCEQNVFDGVVITN